MSRLRHVCLEHSSIFNEQLHPIFLIIPSPRPAEVCSAFKDQHDPEYGFQPRTAVYIIPTGIRYEARLLRLANET